MTVKLSLLDRQHALHYSDEVPVWLNDGDNYEMIGICHVFRDEAGLHFGKLELDKEVSLDFYFYYRSMANNAGIFVFGGLDLMKNALKNIPTTELKDMVVN